MITTFNQSRFNIPMRLMSSFVLTAFLSLTLLTPTRGFAQQGIALPVPGTMLAPSSNFAPAMIKGIKVDPKNPLLFNFLIDPGEIPLSQTEKEIAYTNLIKYFLASLTTPEKDMWVNLSPYESSRIIAQNFSQTEMGRDMLGQDYILKQFTASLMYPEKELGKKFWSEIYSKVERAFGNVTIPVSTFNKVWIVPQKATVFEEGNVAIVVDSHLKIMLEQDYLALDKHANALKLGLKTEEGLQGRALSQEVSQIVRSVILPAIEEEVNNGRDFAQLRQMYNSLILASWFKKRLKMHMLHRMYVNQNKVSGVELEDKTDNQRIYKQYLRAYHKGVYNYIKEENDPVTGQMIPRKYFSGGFAPKVNPDGSLAAVNVTRNTAQLLTVAQSRLDEVSAAMLGLNLKKALLIGALIGSTGIAQADWHHGASDLGKIGKPRAEKEADVKPVNVTKQASKLTQETIIQVAGASLPSKIVKHLPEPIKLELDGKASNIPVTTKNETAPLGGSKPPLIKIGGNTFVQGQDIVLFPPAVTYLTPLHSSSFTISGLNGANGNGTFTNLTVSGYTNYNDNEIKVQLSPEQLKSITPVPLPNILSPGDKLVINSSSNYFSLGQILGGTIKDGKIDVDYTESGFWGKYVLGFPNHTGHASFSVTNLVAVDVSQSDHLNIGVNGPFHVGGSLFGDNGQELGRITSVSDTEARYSDGDFVGYFISIEYIDAKAVHHTTAREVPSAAFFSENGSGPFVLGDDIVNAEGRVRHDLEIRKIDGKNTFVTLGILGRLSPISSEIADLDNARVKGSKTPVTFRGFFKAINDTSIRFPLDLARRIQQTAEPVTIIKGNETFPDATGFVFDSNDRTFSFVSGKHTNQISFDQIYYTRVSHGKASATPAASAPLDPVGYGLHSIESTIGQLSLGGGDIVKLHGFDPVILQSRPVLTGTNYIVRVASLATGGVTNLTVPLNGAVTYYDEPVPLVAKFQAKIANKFPDLANVIPGLGKSSRTYAPGEDIPADNILKNAGLFFAPHTVDSSLPEKVFPPGSIIDGPGIEPSFLLEDIMFPDKNNREFRLLNIQTGEVSNKSVQGQDIRYWYGGNREAVTGKFAKKFPYFALSLMDFPDSIFTDKGLHLENGPANHNGFFNASRTPPIPDTFIVVSLNGKMSVSGENDEGRVIHVDEGTNEFEITLRHNNNTKTKVLLPKQGPRNIFRVIHVDISPKAPNAPAETNKHDNAMTPTGGIDFDPKYLDLNIQDKGMTVDIPKGFEWLLTAPITGFTPKILDISTGFGFTLSFFKGVLNPEQRQRMAMDLYLEHRYHRFACKFDLKNRLA